MTGASAANPKVRRLNWSDVPALVFIVAPLLALGAAIRLVRRDLLR